MESDSGSGSSGIDGGALLERTIVTAYSPSVTIIGSCAFYGCNKLDWIKQIKNS